VEEGQKTGSARVNKVAFAAAVSKAPLPLPYSCIPERVKSPRGGAPVFFFPVRWLTEVLPVFHFWLLLPIFFSFSPLSFFNYFIGFLGLCVTEPLPSLLSAYLFVSQVVVIQSSSSSPQLRCRTRKGKQGLNYSPAHFLPIRFFLPFLSFLFLSFLVSWETSFDWRFVFPLEHVKPLPLALLLLFHLQ
jgi:hypothetical protein